MKSEMVKLLELAKKIKILLNYPLGQSIINKFPMSKRMIIQSSHHHFLINERFLIFMGQGTRLQTLLHYRIKMLM